MPNLTTQGGQTIALLQAFQGLEAAYSAFHEAALAVSEARVAPICVENCGKCCEINTPYLWDIEAKHILGFTLGDGSLGKTLDRCQSWLLDRHKGLTLYGTRSDTRTVEGRVRILKETVVAAATPCPFLNTEKRCDIHDCRPLACRAYGVTRLPSQEECKAPLGHLETVATRAHHDGAGLKAMVSQFLQTLDPEWRASYFLPTDLVRLARPLNFKSYVERIATAKMVAFPVSPAVIWQDQLEQEWSMAGVRR